jgi:1,4-alpha-glucan branching enzyme
MTCRNRFTPEPNLPAYSAKRLIHVVHFHCPAPQARSVSLAGDFTDWQPRAMTQAPDGAWSLTLELNHGHHQYVFLVDGAPVLDPNATGRTVNEKGEPVSLIAVS